MFRLDHEAVLSGLRDSRGRDSLTSGQLWAGQAVRAPTGIYAKSPELWRSH